MYACGIKIRDAFRKAEKVQSDFRALLFSEHIWGCQLEIVRDFRNILLYLEIDFKFDMLYDGTEYLVVLYQTYCHINL